MVTDNMYDRMFNVWFWPSQVLKQREKNDSIFTIPSLGSIDH